MRNFEVINREYINPVDLNVLGQTFNTLEQGHLKTIEKASDLQATLANLDLNEAEAEWRKQKLDTIRQTIENNSTYGNAYSALDNIVKLSGDIKSDMGLIGRLKSQQEYKKFINSIDANNELSQTGKSYFKQLNPYSYQDRYDNKGDVIEGETWKPTITPTKVIPIYDLVIKGINLASKENGTTRATRWLDDKGNVTDDPTKAFDGEVFNTTTKSWEKLSKEKIWQGIKAAIETTPGAIESLQQDFNIALWEHNKNSNNGEFLIVDETTDENGIILSPNKQLDTFIKNKIGSAVEAKSYMTINSIDDYGNGLKTYKAAMKNNTINHDVDFTENLLYSGQSSLSNPIVVKYDYCGELKGQENITMNNISKLYEDNFGISLDFDFDNATSNDYQDLINKVDLLAKESNYTPEQTAAIKTNLRFNIRKLQETKNNYNQIIEGLTDKQKEDIDFISRMNSGSNFDNTNENDKAILKSINDLFENKNAQSVRAVITNQKVFDNMLNLINGDKIDGYKELGFTIGKDKNGYNYIEIDKDNYGSLILFSKTYANINKGAGSLMNNSIKVFDNKGNSITTSNDFPELNIKHIAKIYDHVNNRVNNAISEKIPTEITLSNPNYPGRSWKDAKLIYLSDIGQIDTQEYNRRYKTISDELTTKIASHDFSQTLIYAVDENNDEKLSHKVTNADKITEIGESIKTAAANGRVMTSAAHNPILGAGTNILVYPKIDDEGNPKGTPKAYFVPGLLNNAEEKAFETSPQTIASNKIAIGNEVKQTIYNTTLFDTPTLGNQIIKCLGNDQYVFIQNNKEYILDRDGATKITEKLEEYLQIKDGYQSGYFNAKPTDLEQVIKARKERLNNAISEIAETIAAYTNLTKAEYIKFALTNDLNK